MPARYRESYHFDGGLEQAVIDLIRVGSTGFGSGVRQIALRLARSTPPHVNDPPQFRSAVLEAVADQHQTTELRYASGEMPMDSDGKHELVSVDPYPDGSGLFLSGKLQHQLAEVIEEHRNVHALRSAGIGPTRNILLSGPPGVGKTMTARWLASELKVPLVSLDLAAAVSSYLGSSGRNIRNVMDYAKSGPCVLLLDEFDAIAKHRQDDSDIGELKRIVNVVLVELDRWPDANLLVAATNHPQLLDPAVERRFDHHFHFDLPSEAERLEILENLSLSTGDQDTSILRFVASLTEGQTGSDLERLVLRARRRSILHQTPTGDEILEEVATTSRVSGNSRDKMWLMMAEHLGLSSRQIAARVRVSHPTVSAALKRARTA